VKRNDMQCDSSVESMFMEAIRSGSAAVALRVSAALRGGVLSVSSAAARAGAWLHARRAERWAARDFATMSERELFDIGVTPADVERVIWGASGGGTADTPRSGEAQRGNGDDRRTLIECAMWLHVGYIGTAILVVALLRFMSGETPWAGALAFSVIGWLLAIGGWRRARRLLASDRRNAERALAAPPAQADRPRR
jgi:uncharacterized protein YjiS (DUF1127 family)